MSFSIIVAADEANGIGKGGRLPWHLPVDMAFFKRTTTERPEGTVNYVIMGRKTFESIPAKFRPLANRTNIVLSRSLPDGAHGGTLLTDSLDKALRVARSVENANRIFVIGGGEIYREAIKRPDCAEILLTRVHARFDCDTQLPPFEHAFERTRADGPHQDGDVRFTFETYVRRA